MTNLSASDLAGRRIRQVRERRRWTAKELAARCASAGAPYITATVITNLETRRRASRQITLDEVLLLAHVLEVPPILLFAPADVTEVLEIVPGVEKNAIEAAAWMADDAAMGHRVITGRGKADGLQVNYVKYPQETSPLTLLRYIAEVIRRIRGGEEWLARWHASPALRERYPHEDEFRTAWFERYANRLAQLYGWLARLGHAAPELPPDIAAILDREGIPDWRQLAAERPELLMVDAREMTSYDDEFETGRRLDEGETFPHIDGGVVSDGED